MEQIWSQDDWVFMRLALGLAKGQVGKTATNPAVGCVIVKAGKIIGQGATGDGGRPHGEAVALCEAGELAKGATAYVTLEPCAHKSERGPDCSNALIKAGIARLVCSLKDPDPRTSGQGFRRLMDAGIVVDVGLMAQEAYIISADFQARFQA